MSLFKEVNIGNAGTSTKFGSNDLDLITKLLNGGTGVFPIVKIKASTGWGFWDARLFFRNQLDTYQITIRGPTSNVGSFDLTLPPIIQNDVLAAVGLEQIFTARQTFNKGVSLAQMTAPTGSELPLASTSQLFFDATGHLSSVNSAGTVTDYTASVGPGHHVQHIAGGLDPFAKTEALAASARYIENVADMASDSRRIWINTNSADIEYWDNQTVPIQQILERRSMKGIASGYCDLDGSALVPLSRLSAIGDTQIGAHTTTKITIASRSLIPATLAYEDETNIFSVVQKMDAGTKHKPITTPGTDAAYGILFVDSADSLLKYKRPNGTVDNLSSTANAPTNATYVTITNDATLTNERALTAGDGIQLIDGGVNSTITIAQDYIDMARRKMVSYEECLGSSAVSSDYIAAVSGTDAQITNVTVGGLQEFGVWNLETGTTTTGRAAIQNSNLSSYSLGQGLCVWEANVKVPALSTAGEEFVIRIGFGDSVSGSSVDGVYFIYDRTVTTNWTITAKSNSVSTSNNSATAVGTGWVRLKVVVNAAGTSASFFVNGTEISGSPITTNIPVGAARALGSMASIIKSAGTTTRNLYIDYIAIDYDLTAPR